MTSVGSSGEFQISRCKVTSPMITLRANFVRPLPNDQLLFSALFKDAIHFIHSITNLMKLHLVSYKKGSAKAKRLRSIPSPCHTNLDKFKNICFTSKTFKDVASFCYCAYVLRLLGYSVFLRNLSTNTTVFLRSS